MKKLKLERVNLFKATQPTNDRMEICSQKSTAEYWLQHSSNQTI